MTEKDIETVMAVNLYGAVSCIRNVVPHMQNGLIVNVASAAGLFGVPYLSAYSASKAALIAFSQALRAELSGTGTKISIVYPGYIQTDFFKNEKNVGGAVRPKGPYYSAAKAARIIVNSIERNKKDIYISKESIGLEIASRISRSVVEKVMNSIKIKLEVKAEENHG